MGEFSPPLFLNHADTQTSNTSTRLWFYYIITKIHPPFQNPGSAPVVIPLFLRFSFAAYLFNAVSVGLILWLAYHLATCVHST